MLKGKTVVLGVTGGIAAYKIANLASMLVKLHCDVQVIMTENATNFIHPIAFETLTKNKCLIDTFDRNFQHKVEHVSIAKRADVVLIAPATANVIGKMANGIADDMLTTTVLACRCKKIVSPAMNTNMYCNPIVQDNLKKLQHYGFEIIEADTGFLACEDIGQGKMPSPEVLLQYILKEIAFEKDMKGKRVLITAGPTREAIDPVRYITNHSTGKMGYALARNCMLRGAEVALVTGPTSIDPPPFVHVIPVVSAKEMFDTVCSHAKTQDIIIKSAAVADYRPITVSEEKMKKSDSELSIPLERTDDILQYLGHKTDLDEAVAGGAFGVNSALAGETGKMISFKRVSSNPYVMECTTADVTAICNKEKGVPIDWITENGSNISDEFINYASPLIQGEVEIPMQNGLPHFAFRK